MYLTDVTRSFNRPEVDFTYVWGSTKPPPDTIAGTEQAWWRTRQYGGYSGEVIDQFYRRKNRGEFLPYTDYERWDTKAHLTGATTVYRSGGGSPYSDYLGCARLGVVESVIGYDTLKKYQHHIMTEWESEFKAGLQEAAANAYDSFDALTFAAELPSTVKTITGLARRFANAKRQLAKKGLSLQAAMDRWLEWRYGWRTLLFDIDDAAKALAGKRHFGVISESAKFSDSFPWVNESNYGFSVHSLRVGFLDHVKFDARCRYTALFEPPLFTVDPLVTTWELIPFSFVADWFTSIGDWIRALVVDLLQRQYTACYGLRFTVERTVTGIEAFDLLSDVTAVECLATLESSAEFRSRIRTNLPIYPQLRLDINPQKLLDAIALWGNPSDPRRRY